MESLWIQESLTKWIVHNWIHSICLPFNSKNGKQDHSNVSRVLSTLVRVNPQCPQMHVSAERQPSMSVHHVPSFHSEYHRLPRDTNAYYFRTKYYASFLILFCMPFFCHSFFLCLSTINLPIKGDCLTPNVGMKSLAAVKGANPCLCWGKSTTQYRKRRAQDSKDRSDQVFCPRTSWTSATAYFQHPTWWLKIKDTSRSSLPVWYLLWRQHTRLFSAIIIWLCFLHINTFKHTHIRIEHRQTYTHGNSSQEQCVLVMRGRYALFFHLSVCRI